MKRVCKKDIKVVGPDITMGRNNRENNGGKFV